MVFQVENAASEAVNLEGLNLKIGGKYIKFLKSKFKGKLDQELNPIPWMDATSDEQDERDIQSRSSIRLDSRRLSYNDTSLMSSQATLALQSPDISESSTTSRYININESKSTVYYIKPGTSEIYLLDFKLRSFCKE